MFKSTALSFVTPKVTSKVTSGNNTKTNPTKSAAITWAGTRSSSAKTLASGNKRSFSTKFSFSKLKIAFVPAISLLLVVAMGGMLALHLFWVNTYSSKGFELKKVQTSIIEQTEVQKKLLVKQSLLNSTVSLSDLENTNLVPVHEVENLNGNTFAQANVGAK